MNQPATAGTVALRPPSVVMRLARLGSFHQTRLSFLRVLLRRAIAEKWRFDRLRFDIDAKGVGTAVYAVDLGNGRTVSLVAFGHDLPPELRTDRVIAEAWDATFALFDGVPTDGEIKRLRANVPKQEAGRCLGSELVLARANRSVRLFDSVVSSLAAGRQPDRNALEATGYLMRTTAVYGNGKFGIADRDRYAARPEFEPPFQAEMLAVYLIRTFTADLVEHMARLRAPATAVPLEPALRRRLGIGNSTGLGMAPFLVRHPTLLDRWMAARETALARVRAIPTADATAVARFRDALAGAKRMVRGWTTDDAIQAPRIATLGGELDQLAAFATDDLLATSHPWDRIHRWAEGALSIEGQEMTVSLLLEPHGAIVDDLAAEMSIDEGADFRIDGTRSCADTRTAIERQYPWALAYDFADARENARFWYVSEEKLEPRIGDRASEDGADLEQPLAVARDIAQLHAALRDAPAGDRIGAFLLRHPEHRHAVRRVQRNADHAYAEIQDNLIAESLRPVDILRSKLACFGATRFDPRSDKWLRITLYQGAPYPHELFARDWDGWIWPAA